MLKSQSASLYPFEESKTVKQHNVEQAKRYLLKSLIQRLPSESLGDVTEKNVCFLQAQDQYSLIYEAETSQHSLDSCLGYILTIAYTDQEDPHMQEICIGQSIDLRAADKTSQENSASMFQLQLTKFLNQRSLAKYLKTVEKAIQSDIDEARSIIQKEVKYKIINDVDQFAINDMGKDVLKMKSSAVEMQKMKEKNSFSSEDQNLKKMMTSNSQSSISSIAAQATQLTSYSESILRNIKDDQNTIICHPFNDKMLLLVAILRKKLYDQENIKNLRKALIITPSQAIGEQLYKELSKLGIIQTPQNQVGLACGNLCQKTLKKQILSQQGFEDDYKHAQIVIATIKQVYQMSIRGIIAPLTFFDLILFEDVSLHNDKNHLSLINQFKYDYYHSGLTKFQIISFLSQPLITQDPLVLNQYKQNLQLDMFSEILKIEEIQKIQPILSSINIISSKQSLVSQIIRNPEIIVDTILIIVECDQEIKSSEQMKICYHYLGKDLNSQVERNFGIKINLDNAKITKDDSYGAPLEASGTAEPNAILISSQYLIANKSIKIDLKIDHVVYIVRSQNFDQRVLINLSDLQTEEMEITIIALQETSPLYQSLKIYQDKTFSEFVVPMAAPIAQSVDNCKKETGNSEIDKYDKLRELNKPYFIIKDPYINRKKVFQPECIILPHCIKTELKYSHYEVPKDALIHFTKKVEAENFLCLMVLRRLYEKDILDKHLYFNKPEPKSQEKYKQDLFRLDNGYIQKPFSIAKDQNELFIHVFMSQDPQYSQKMIGVLVKKKLPEMNKKSYQVKFDQQTRNIIDDHLLNSSKVSNKIALMENLPKRDLLTYNMNTSIKIALPQDSRERINFLQKLKFYHVYSFYQIMNMDATFLRGVLKNRFTFSQELFGNQLKHVWQRYRDLLVRFVKKIRIEPFEEDDIQKVYMYILPVVKKTSGSYELDIGLIEICIRHVQMHLLTLLDKTNLVMPDSLRSLINDERFDRINSLMWNQIQGNKLIMEAVPTSGKEWKVVKEEKKKQQIVKEKEEVKEEKEQKKEKEKKEEKLEEKKKEQRQQEEEKQVLKETIQQWPVPPGDKEWSYVSILQPQKMDRRAFFEKGGEKLTLPQFFAVQQGIHLDRRENPYFFKFSKVQLQLLDSVVTKNYKFQMNQKALESMRSFTEELSTQLTPSQTVEINPIPFEYFLSMQHACTHLLKLNDYLRTQAFIENVLLNEKFLKLVQNSKNDSTFMTFDFGQDSQQQDITSKLMSSIPLLNAALTTPSSQLAENNERLESYGSSLISLVVLLELYLTREIKYMENDLDSIRKQRIQNEMLSLANLDNNIYEYMLTEPPTQSNISSSSGLGGASLGFTPSQQKSQSIIRFVVPGGLGGPHFQDKVKKSKQQSQKQRMMSVAAMIETAKRELRAKKEGHVMCGYERQRYWEMLELVIKKKTFREIFEKKYPEMWEVVRQTIKENRFVEEENLIAGLPQRLMDAGLYREHIEILFYELTFDKLSKSLPQFEEQRRSQPYTFEKEDVSTMELRINRDQKLADTVESLCAAMSMIDGLPTGYAFMQNLGIVKTDFKILQKKLQEDRQRPKSIETKAHIDQLYEVVKNVEDKIGYVFKDKSLLVQAFTHSSYSVWQELLDKRIKLQDYNILEFLGDSVLNFLVLDFFYLSSDKYALDYGHEKLHKLKTEITNNHFFSLILIEKKLNEHIILDKKKSYDQKYTFYQDLVKSQFQGKGDNGKSRITKEIFEDYFLNKQNLPHTLQEVNLKQDFMNPRVIQAMAQLTKTRRLNMEDTQDDNLKVFGDVLEALFGAIFIDTGCNLTETKEIFMKTFEPYLYVYGNIETMTEHPRTETISLWTKQLCSRIRNHKISISHLNETEADRTKINYRGFLEGREVVLKKFILSDQNKSRQFYTLLKRFIVDLINEIKKRYPKIDADITQANQREIAIEKGQKISDEPHKTSEEIYREVLNIIEDYRKTWNEINKNFL